MTIINIPHNITDVRLVPSLRGTHLEMAEGKVSDQTVIHWLATEVARLSNEVAALTDVVAAVGAKRCCLTGAWITGADAIIFGKARISPIGLERLVVHRDRHDIEDVARASGIPALVCDDPECHACYEDANDDDLSLPMMHAMIRACHYMPEVKQNEFISPMVQQLASMGWPLPREYYL